MSREFTVPEDLTQWSALSCPIKGLRFDEKTLAFLDTDKDGHIRTGEVRAALDYLEKKGVTMSELLNPEKAPRQKDEEKLQLYKRYLGEFLQNFVTMDAKVRRAGEAIFQTGRLLLDGQAINLCFHVENEEAHAALAEKSNCFVLYLKLTRPVAEQPEPETRQVCAVVTKGRTTRFYVGRNGVFYDRDGLDWEATVTRVITNPVSLVEAFGTPWRKLGEGVVAAVQKFLGASQAKAVANVEQGTAGGQATGAALASSVAAVGIGLGMVGAAFASILAAVKGMTPAQLALAVVAIILAVSLPSVILAWFKLLRRDLGGVLNAGGWAINRQIRP